MDKVFFGKLNECAFLLAIVFAVDLLKGLCFSIAFLLLILSNVGIVENIGVVVDKLCNFPRHFYPFLKG